jgi:hypothetical protein
VPDQAPLAVHVVVYPEVQLRVALCPGITALGLREMLSQAGSEG